MGRGLAMPFRRWIAVLVGAPLLLAGAAAILLGREGLTTAILLVVAAPLVYAGANLPVPRIKAGGVRLTFEEPAETGVARPSSAQPVAADVAARAAPAGTSRHRADEATYPPNVDAPSRTVADDSRANC